ncbi:MAG TPA: hypothetical protein VH479_17620, partial [Acidimicrobiales bacterium]
MDMHVRLDMDDDGPVVVKTATPAAVDRLRLEIDRLRQAAHPGVVTVIDAAGAPGPPACELRTRYSGEPVGGWAGTVDSVAGLGASVATTLADLHGLGLVHGRIDASHILVADDGRPRLCGFSHPGGAAPADDVAALATVMADLLDQARPTLSGSPLHRWLSGSQARVQERALRVVLQRAADPLPTRRPNARVLADAILAAVPTAELPPPVHATTPTTPSTPITNPPAPHAPVPDHSAAPTPPSHWPAAPAAALSDHEPLLPSPWTGGGPDAEPAPPSRRPTARSALHTGPASFDTPTPSQWSARLETQPTPLSDALTVPHTPAPSAERPPPSPCTAS